MRGFVFAVVLVLGACEPLGTSTEPFCVADDPARLAWCSVSDGGRRIAVCAGGGTLASCDFVGDSGVLPCSDGTLPVCE